MLSFIPPHSTSYLQTCRLAVFRSFKRSLRHRRLIRRHRDEKGMTATVFGRMGVARYRGPLRPTIRRCAPVGVRDHSDAHFKEAVEEAATLHAHDELFSKHIDPEPPPEDPVEWAMADASDDEDDAPMSDAPPEPELVDMPSAPVSAPRMSNFERCITMRLVYSAGPRRVPPKNCHLHHLSVSLCCLMCRLSRVSCPRLCFHVPTTRPRLQVSDTHKNEFIYFF